MSVNVTLENGELVIRAPVANPPPPSKSGKTLLLVSTGGSIKTGVQHAGKEVVIGLNAWIPNQ